MAVTRGGTEDTGMLILILISVVAVLDQSTKWFVVRHLDLGTGLIIVPGFLDLRHVRNTGAAWGMFGDTNAWLVLFSVGILLCLVFFRRRFLGNASRLQRIAMALIIGGIVGNVLDRMRYGYVVDFLDCHWQNHHFPTFNIADSAICSGVAAYLIAAHWIERRSIRSHASTPDESSSPSIGT